MKFKRYVDWVNSRWADHKNKEKDLVIAALGLSGEVGEVIEHFKKHIRDGRPLTGNDALYLELGDVLHYWVRLCDEAGVDPKYIMELNVEKLTKRGEPVRAGLKTI